MTKQILKSNMRHARHIWGDLPRASLCALKGLVETHNLSVSSGHLQFLDGRWYVTHAGLLRLASRKHCAGIRVQSVREFCDPAAQRWAFKATVFKGRDCKGFVGYGNVDPSNTSDLTAAASCVLPNGQGPHCVLFLVSAPASVGRPAFSRPWSLPSCLKQPHEDFSSSPCPVPNLSPNYHINQPVKTP